MAKTDILIEIGGESFQAWLDDQNSPNTVREILQTLPIETTVNRWGDEFYFRIPVSAGEENGVEQVSIGDLAYWSQGNAFCIFFGRTPLSSNDEEIIPASAVNLLGRIEQAERLKSLGDGETVRISHA